MGKHLTKDEWIKYFKLYEVDNGNNFWTNYFVETNKNCISPELRKACKCRFTKKYKAYKAGNQNIIISMAGKKSGPGKGRPKKQQEINWDNFTKEELIEIAKRYNEITKSNSKSEKHKESLRTENNHKE